MLWGANAKMCVDPEYLFKDYFTTESRLLFHFVQKPSLAEPERETFLACIIYYKNANELNFSTSAFPTIDTHETFY
jgi:hypothetical protein